MMKRGVVLFFLMCIGICLMAEVWVYNGADQSLKSTKFIVQIKQSDRSYSSFVYENDNQFIDKMNVMSNANHFSGFSFSGSVKVIINCIGEDILNAEVYPLSNHTVTNIQNGLLTLELKEPQKLYIKINKDKENPLFLFADEPERDVPDRDDENVVWFEPGVHDIGENYKLESNKIYYFEGGSYVYGSLHGKNISDVQIRGRGILSGRKIEHHGYKECHCFDGVAIYMSGEGVNQLVEGITIVDPAMYCILSRGQMECRNVKCFGWWFETDGFGAGDNSVLTDSFFKVNDDVVKLYSDNMVVHNLVIYQQMNGAPFQFAWSSQSSRDGQVSDIDIVACEVSNSRLWTSNRPLINMRKGVGNDVRNYIFSNIRADQGVAQLIGINTTGKVKGLTLKNITIDGEVLNDSYLNGRISDVKFENVMIGGACIDRNEKINLHKKGNVVRLKYQCE